MKLLNLFRKSTPRGPQHDLYAAIIAQARTPAFYLDLDVPDSPDGRFEMILLHAFLVLRRLKSDHGRTEILSQNLFDLMFEDMDTSMRELGIGDVGVPKRIKKMVEGFYGRIAAYEDGLASDREEPLALSLKRNVYRTLGEGEEPHDDTLSALSGYVRGQARHLDAVSLDDICAGRVSFAAFSGFARA